jgi:hypothetical protein
MTGFGGNGTAERPASGFCGTSRAVRSDIVAFGPKLGPLLSVTGAPGILGGSGSFRT